MPAPDCPLPAVPWEGWLAEEGPQGGVRDTLPPDTRVRDPWGVPGGAGRATRTQAQVSPAHSKAPEPQPAAQPVNNLGLSRS